MKPYLFSLIAAAAACGLASAQTAYTTPVGYVTQALTPSKFNLIGLTVQTPVAVAGDLEDVTGAVLTDSDVVDFAAVLTPSRTYIIEITSGTAFGASQDFVTVSGSTVTLPGAITGLANGDKYQIRVAPTLETVFGTTTSVLQKGAVSGSADIVYLPNGSGGYLQYWQNLAGSWRNFIGGSAASNIPVIYLDGILIQKRAAAASLVFSGEVKTIGSTTAIIKGFNPIGSVYPAGSTLQNIGLADDLLKGAVAGSADIVHIPNGSGGYTLYWLNLASSWRNFIGGGAAPADIPLTTGFFIEKRNVGTVTVDIAPPSTYATPSL
ncbi:MAG: hypothetical protein Q8Q59_12320 [Luteolibacter sp.]|jgi:hypothetical protein|nr:hypothetical protein [Luteolibacter sp.]